MNSKKQKIQTFVNSGTYKRYLSKWKTKNPNDTETTFRKSDDYINGYVQGLSLEEYRQYLKSILDDNIEYNKELKNEIAELKKKTDKNDKEIKSARPKLYLLPVLITLSLTLVSSIVVQIKGGGSLSLNLGSIILIIFSIFFFAFIFLIASGQYFLCVEKQKKNKK